MKKSINSYKELMTEMEKNKNNIIITKELFEWLYHYTDCNKIDDNTLKINGYSNLCVLED